MPLHILAEEAKPVYSQKNSPIVSSMSPKLDDRFFVDLPKYSVDSIKHTVLLKILLPIFLLISIKSTVHWKFSRQINLCTVSIKNTVFNSVQCTLVCIHSRYISSL